VTEFHYEQATQHSLWTHGRDETEGTEPRRETVRQLRERLQFRGVTVLSNADLVSLVFGAGPAPASVIHQVHSLFAATPLPELVTIDFGLLSSKYLLGDANAAQVSALVELARRLTLPPETKRQQITSPADAATLLMADMGYLDHEELRVLCLDTKNFVVANIRLYQGTINSSVLRAAEIFKPAVTRNCPGILICHNHPSGDPAPSPEDIAATEQLVHTGKFLEIELVDHLIIGSPGRFCSLKERMRW
jgi:DNA repair protein RadC